jgi:NitT/TauT family transport system substrate-binding protein
VITRARASALIFGGTAVAALSQRAGTQTLLPLHVVTTYLESAAGAFYAQSLGLFRKYGLLVELEVMANGSAAAAAVIGGAANVGSSNIFSLVIAHSKGIGLKLVVTSAEYLNDYPTTALVVAKDSAAHSARDLRGETIAVTGLGDLDAVSVEVWLDTNGVDPKAVKFVELRPPEMAAALDHGSVAAAEIGSPALQVALSNGRILGLPYTSIADRFNQNGWYMRADWMAEHREEARRFSRAVFEAQRWANHNRDASGKLLAQWSKLDPKVIASMTRVSYSERIDPTLIRPLISIAARYKAIPGPFPATDLYDPAL